MLAELVGGPADGAKVEVSRGCEAIQADHGPGQPRHRYVLRPSPTLHKQFFYDGEMTPSPKEDDGA